MSEAPTLQDLVTLAMRRHKASARHLSKLAQDRGYKLVYTTLSQIHSGTYKSRPRDDTLRALAWLAGVHEDVAFTAAGRPVPGPPFADELPPGVDELPPKARKTAIEMLRTLIDLNRANQERAEEGVSSRDLYRFAARARHPEIVPDQIPEDT